MNTAPSSPSVAKPLRFGPSLRFELQPAEHRLLVDGQPAALGRRAIDLLIVLAERPDHLLTKNELLDRVWPGLVVEEANLQMQISNLRKVLGSELITTVPGRGYRFAAPAGAVTASVPAAAPSPTTAEAAIPQRPVGPRLIGRKHELAQLEALLQESGCLTLVGPSGVGKTSLARSAAARWPGRSVWVDLAALMQGRQVAGALARALDLQLTGDDADAPTQLVAALRTQTLLLVLDNAEHLIETCAALATLLSPLETVKLLVTSQVPLAIAGERVLRLGPLALPAADTDLDDGALALLVERIAAADHRFTPTPQALPLLRALCAQLDGLPLALEMAAARVPLLGLQGVHDALAQRFALLTRGHRDAATRHRTLHNALDWSYGLLSAEEQRLFRALGVFAGGFTLELAISLMSEDNADGSAARWDVIDGLAALADRSLMVVGEQDPPRYHLLESMRAYALEQLAAQDEHAAFRRRHAMALLGLFNRHTIGNATTLAQCLADMENAREAIAWAREHELGVAAQISAQGTLVSTFSVWRQESGNWLFALEPLMDSPEGRALPPQVQATWWTERARVASIRRDASARPVARRAMTLWQPLQQPRQLLRATLIWVRSIATADAELDEACAELQTQAAAIPDLPLFEQLSVQGALTRAAVIRGDTVAALAGREAEIALARQLGHQDSIDAAESGIVNMLAGLGRHGEAAERGRALMLRLDADGSGRNGNLPWALGALVSALLTMGQVGEVRALLPQMHAIGRRFSTVSLLPLLSRLAAAEQRYSAAALLLGYVRQSFESRTMTFERQEETSLDRVFDTASAALGAGPAQALVEQGRSLSDEAAEELAGGIT